MWTTNDAKLIAILVISVSSFFFGLLPNLCGLGSRCQRSIILSAVLCFGGGVLLATSMVHILPEIRENLPHCAEVVLCFGFFAMYLLDIIVQFLNNNHGDDVAYEEAVINAQERGVNNCCVPNYGAVGNEAPAHQNEPVAMIATWNCTGFGLLIAFTVHAMLEGLVIGVQTSAKNVFLLLMAVSCHKLVVTFCLGAELSSNGRPLHSVITLISVYVFGSALGVLCGMLLHTYEAALDSILVIPIFQGLAAGTLLYIVVSEILPRERGRGLPIKSVPVQYFSIVTGFTLMVFINFFVKD